MKIRALVLALAATAMIAGAVAPTALFAQSPAAKAAVDAGKAAGTVGEQGDGYLGIVSGGDTALRASVSEINAGRKQVYADTAAKTGVTIEAAGEATAKLLLQRVAPGQFYKPLGGTWTKK